MRGAGRLQNDNVAQRFADCSHREDRAMKAPAHAPPRDTKQFESPEALRSRLVKFAIVTRNEALRRGKIEEPVSCGPVLVGPRVRLTDAA